MTMKYHVDRIGSRVLIGSDIPGVIEEVIFSRNQTSPLYLVNYWIDGDLRSHRFWPTECLPAPGHSQ